jgi:hypothetical protein
VSGESVQAKGGSVGDGGEGTVAAPLAQPGPAPARSDWLFRFAFSATLLALVLIVFVPIVETLRAGQFFGYDWGEYLYSAPYYLRGESALYLYHFPVLPLLYLPASILAGPRSLGLADLGDVVSGLLIIGIFGAGYLACSAHTRNRWAGLVGAAALAGFPHYFYEAAWGGQAQLVAYIFGLLALWVILRNGIPIRSWKQTLGAGVLLALCAASELYAASFVLLAVILVLIAAFAVSSSRRRTLTTIVSVLIPPAIVGGAVLLTDTTLSHPYEQPSIWHYWNYAPLFPRLWRSLSFQDVVLVEVYVGILLVYLSYRVIFKLGNGVNGWVVPALGGAALLVGFFGTPAPAADRSLYPLGFPLGFAAAELAACWPSSRGRAVPRTVWRLNRGEVSWTLPVLVIASLTVAGVQIGADAEVFPLWIADYSYDQGSISQLAWLAEKPGGIVIDDQRLSLFPTQWETNKSLFPGPGFQPDLLTSAAKQETAVLGTALSYGPRWFDEGGLLVTDAEPDWGQPDPGILMFQEGHLYETIESDDFENVVSYSTTSDPGSTTTSTLFDAPSLSISATTSTTWVYYNWTGINATRTLEVLPSGLILLNYSFDFTSTIPRSISIYLTSPGRAATNGSILTSSNQCSNASVSQSYSGGWLPSIPISFQVGACSQGAVLGSHYVASDQFGIFQLAYDLTPANASVRNLTLSLSILPSIPPSATPVLDKETNVLASNDIRWVVLSRDSNQIILQRFMDDPIYALYRTTPDFLVLTA